MTEKNTDPKGREIIMTRTLNAPRDLVWEVWTNPEHIAKWWGPNGFTNTIQSMDVKPGGEWNFIMHGPNKMDFPNRIIYSEVEKPKRLVYTHGDDAGTPEQQFHVTVTFDEQDGKTLLTMHSVFASAAVLKDLIEKAGAAEGGKQTLNKLEEYLKAMIN